MLTIQPPPRCLQVRNRGAATEEHAGQVGVDHLAPFVRRLFGDVGQAADGGVVDEDVEPAEAIASFP